MTNTALKFSVWPALLLGIALLGGCAPVEPWQKGNLAKSHMAFDPDPLEAKWVRRTYQAKEAASGGYGAEGGGCGCN